ncbi:hypothetical protein LPJ81_003117 [Coemansia sp. IMI 209127]|nr:hypothetical protein LPJ81_003117 [Coemansia sp. IMI 209127]
MLILEHGHSSGVRTYEEHGFLESVLRIVSPATETLSLRIRRLDVKTILSIIEKHPSSIATIRHLSLMTTSVSFGDIVRVLELMPLLTEFDCMMNVVEDKNEIVSSRGYVEKRYIERFSPLNRNIRLVRFMNMNVRNANDMALAAMLLCLMCPKFTLAHLPCVPCDSYVGNIKKHLGGKSFGRYKDRIECLFLGE